MPGRFPEGLRNYNLFIFGWGATFCIFWPNKYDFYTYKSFVWKENGPNSPSFVHLSKKNSQNFYIKFQHLAQKNLKCFFLIFIYGLKNPNVTKSCGGVLGECQMLGCFIYSFFLKIYCIPKVKMTNEKIGTCF